MEAELAKRIARDAHRGQYRRDGQTPYFEHLRDTAMRLDGMCEKEIATAWLHDVLEDTNVTADDLLAEGISQEAVDAIKILTKGDGSYEEYLSLVKANPIATKVKIADMLANMSDCPTKRQIIRYSKGLLFLLSE